MLRTSIQFTVEELEQMLDLLGLESIDEIEEKKRLREKLREALQFMREKNSSHDIA